MVVSKLFTCIVILLMSISQTVEEFRLFTTYWIIVATVTELNYESEISAQSDTM